MFAQSIFCITALFASLGPAKQDSSVVLTASGVAYAQADWERDIVVRETLYTHKVGNRGAKDPKKAEKQREGLRAATLSAFVNETLWRLSVGDAGKAVRTSRDYADALANAQARYAKVFGRGKESFDDLCALLPDEATRQRLQKLVAQEAEQDAYCRTHFRDDYVVTSNLVEKTLKDIAESNANVAVTNAAIFAFASNLVSRARAGEDFAALVDRHSQDAQKEPGGALGECDKASFPLEGDTLWPILKSLKAGGVTDPIETEDGICIYRCNKVVEKSESTGEFALDLSRLVLYRALPYPEMTFEQCRRELEKSCRQDVMDKILGAKRAELKIDLPNGADGIPAPFIRRFRKFLSPEVVKAATAKGQAAKSAADRPKAGERKQNKNKEKNKENKEVK